MNCAIVRALIALPSVRDLSLCAKHLFVDATMVGSQAAWAGMRVPRHGRAQGNLLVEVRIGGRETGALRTQPYATERYKQPKPSARWQP
jgi:hypothetical protein